MSFIWQSVLIVNVNMLGLPLVLNSVYCIHKSDIKTKKDRCVTARHFSSICCHPINPHDYLKVELIKQVLCDVRKDIESILREREKYWQCQLFTNTHGMNSFSDLYSRSRKGCRKSNLFITTLYFNYLHIYACGVARTNQTSEGELFCEDT